MDPRDLTDEEKNALEFRIENLLLTNIGEDLTVEDEIAVAYMQGCVETITWIVKGPIHSPDELLFEAARRYAGVILDDIEKARIDPSRN